MFENLILVLFGFDVKPEPIVTSDRTKITISRSRDFVGFAESQINNKIQFKCFDELMHRESSWRSRKNPELAKNKNSSAYGIPQALPGNKMATHGSDWAFNPITQIRWALDYIDERYGSPCKALEFHDRKGYY